METPGVKEAKRAVVEAGNRLVALGLVARTWGNVSCRVDAKTFAITPSGLAYERLTEDSIVLVDIGTLAYEGAVRPSSEKAIHAAAYRLDGEAGFVIHTHQTYATCVSVSGFSKLQPDEAELARLGGSIGLGRYAMSATKKLAGIVSAQMAQGKRAILMKGHGALLVGRDSDEAFDRAQVLEAVCRRSMADLPDGNDTPQMPDEAVQKIIRRIQSQRGGFAHVLLLSSEAVRQAMEQADALPAVIDDFAQIAGWDMKKAVADDGQDAVRKLKNRNAVYLAGIGALCGADSPSDAQAVATLVEKNALAVLNARRNGDRPGLPFWDKAIMRTVYVKKYAKGAAGVPPAK